MKDMTHHVFVLRSSYASKVLFLEKDRTFIYENHFDDRVVRDINLMGAHAVSAAVSRPVVTVAKLFGRDIVDLRKRRRRRKCERDFIDERDYMISGRGDCEKYKHGMINGLV